MPITSRIIIRCAVFALALLCALYSGAGKAADILGQRVVEVIEQFEADGYRVVYSSDVIKPWMRVREQPASDAAPAQLAEIIEPYGLLVQKSPDGAILIVRGKVRPESPTGDVAGIVVGRESKKPQVGIGVTLASPIRRTRTTIDGAFRFASVHPGRHTLTLISDDGAVKQQFIDVEVDQTTRVELIIPDAMAFQLSELVVTASQYELVRGPARAPVLMTADDLAFMPNPGDDPLRAVSRLPGMATSDLSGKSNIRGGEVDEMLVRFDGLRLYDPFHLKDFRSVFSSIDPAVTQQMNVYTGGFPSTFGDRMSSVVDIASLPATEQPVRELSLSFFNASALAQGGFADGKGDWLVSGRRGNLDLFFNVVEPKLGDPTYVDMYSRMGYEINDGLSVTANLLIFDDNIELFDSDREERARADYRDSYYWLRFDLSPQDELLGNLIWAHSELDTDRKGSTNQRGVASGSLSDQRAFTIESLQTEWEWQPDESFTVGFGGSVSTARGKYRYADQVVFALLFDTPGAPTTASRITDLKADLRGNYYGAYTNIRAKLLPGLAAEAGLRWDKETVSGENADRLSPRFALMYSVGENTDLRLSWGRYYQASAINELQLSDGITRLHSPQRSDHLIAGLDYHFNNGVDFRFEAYQKRYDDLRPRFENFLNPLVVLPELKPDRLRIAPDDSVARGIEATLQHPGAGPWSWWLSYAWASVKDQVGGRDVRRSWDQAHKVGLGGGWRTEAWEISFAGNYRTGWPTTSLALESLDPVPTVATGPRNANRLNEHISADIRIARYFEFTENNSLTLFLEVSNVFNRKNKCCVEYEVDSETGQLLLESERTRGLPFIPSAGFTWRF